MPLQGAEAALWSENAGDRVRRCTPPPHGAVSAAPPCRVHPPCHVAPLTRPAPALAVLWLSLVFLVAVLLTAPIARSDLPSPRFDRLVPLGTAAGSTLEIEVAGPDLDGPLALLADHPGITATPVPDKPNRFLLTVAADVPEGTYDLRLLGRWGISNPRLFAVSHGLPELTETEPNNAPEESQELPVPCMVNGMSDGNGEDVFRVALRNGQRVVIECAAQRLDSALDANVSVLSLDGRLLASGSDEYGRDPLADFVAPADGLYLIRLADLSFRGGLPYRLLVTDRPHVENVFPAAVQAQKSNELVVLGRNLGPSSEAWQQSGTPPLQALRIEFVPPAEPLQLAEFFFYEHPTTHSVLPTAATYTLVGCQVRTVKSCGIHPQPLLVIDTPVSLEAEPNDTPPQAQPTPAAGRVIMAGRFERPRDSDWFQFAPSVEGTYAVEVYCERIAGRADPYLVVQDVQGERLAEFDDFGPRYNAFDGHLRDPVGMVQLRADETYRFLVRDRYGRGGPRFQYVLFVRPATPDFFAAAIHSQNPGPAGLNLRRGGAAWVDIVLQPQDGYSGPVTISAEGLPPGVHFVPTTLRFATTGSFVLWSDADAPEWSGTIRLIAEGRQGDQVIRRMVRPYTRVWPEPNIGSSRPTRELGLAIHNQVPFALRLEPEVLVMKPGEQARVRVKAARYWPGANERIALQPLGFPSVLQMQAGEIPAGNSETEITLTLNQGISEAEFTVALLGQSQVPFSKDPQVVNPPPTLVPLPSQPLTVRVVPP